MNNKEIAGSFRLLAELMELHNENPYKIRSYANAYISLRKVDQPFSQMDESTIAGIKGVGSSVAKKVLELVESGEMEALQKLKEITPVGVQQILSIKGIGPKKVKQIWKELGAESPGELLYACQENRLKDLKGFGLKSQKDYEAKIEYFLDSQEKSLYATIENDAIALHQLLKEHFPNQKCNFIGELARKCPIITAPSLILEMPFTAEQLISIEGIELDSEEEGCTIIRFLEKAKFQIFGSTSDKYETDRFQLTADDAFLSKWKHTFQLPGEVSSQEEIFKAVSMPTIPAEIMEGEGTIEQIQNHGLPNLVTDADLKGILHNHSTYSDGLHSLRDMSVHVKENGYAYFGICDHSQSAFYANGLKPERVLEQIEEIDEINKDLAPFKVYKGIESDILNDGSLDYSEDILEMFDFVVASVHSNLRMDEAKATQRLITAIENPYTRILGHPTGRLLLSRKGYPIDFMKVIDACSEHRVVIELNANPLRLDLDYTWIPYALEKNVMIAINPDAHSKGGIQVTRFGVAAARKGWLTTNMCLNALPLDQFQKWVDQGRV
jgi:DNA polymerase (family 10)